MTTVIDLKERLSRVDVSNIAVKSIKQTSDDLVDWQKEQLFTGKNSAGKMIRPFYKPATKAIKKKKGQPIDRVTLKDQGDFYDAINVDVGTEVWNIYSLDPKAKFLEGRYSPKIYGLNNSSLAGYTSDVRPVFLKKMEQATGLKIL